MGFASSKTEWSSSAILMHQYVSTQLAAGLVHSMHFLCEYFFLKFKGKCQNNAVKPIKEKENKIRGAT